MWMVMLCILLGVFLFLRRKRPGMGGPQGWPFVGNVFQLDSRAPHHTFTEWVKNHGGLYKVTLFGTDVVIASSEAAIRQVLITNANDFADRPQLFRQQVLVQNGIVKNSQSPHWALKKKLSMAGLRMVGEGVQRLESIAKDLLDEMLDHMEATKGKPFNPRPLLHEAVSNINATLVFGRRFTAEEEKEILYLDVKYNEMGNATAPGKELDAFPWLRFFPNKTYKSLTDLRDRVNAFFVSMATKTINAMEEEGDGSSALMDLIKYRKQQLKETGKTAVDMKTLRDVAKDLIVPANLTTRIALQGLIAILASDLSLQKRCQAEVDKVMGQRAPALSHRASLPFVESLVMELLRYLSHTPLAIPHLTSKDTHLQGKSIPKGTQVMVNLWQLHHDAALWEDPWTFNPERFLDEERQLLKSDHPLRKRLLPFGAGRRVCVGEAMARNRLFLFVSTMLQRLTFLPEHQGAALPTDPRTWKLATTIYPEDFNIRAEIRE